jgi:hypothetical protein
VTVGTTLMAFLPATDFTAVSAFMSSLLDDPDAATARATLGVTPVDTQTHAAGSKATPVDADELPLADSAAAFGLKKLTWVNAKATLKTYFDTLYSGATPKQIQPISASIAANALTISAAALTLDFRSTTLTNGTVTNVAGTPSNLVIAATDSFGLTTVFGNQRIAILALNNAGTIELAASALYGGAALDETGVITTVAAATLATHIKSTTVRTGLAYRVIGFVDATFTTAVGWGSLVVVQGQGGQALAAMSSLGYGQTWQNVAGSRVFGTTYYNTTGRPIQVFVTTNSGSASSISIITINGAVVGDVVAGSTAHGSGVFIVPPGGSYSVSAGTSSISYWSELR